jgi:hypothetical protein
MMRGLSLLLLCLALPAGAADLETLVAADKLRVTSWLEPVRDIAVGQEVKLAIEVSTPRWFAGGTRITPPEVDGVVILRRNEFAFNISRREAGTTWVVQRWELELYPQRAGTFRLPPVALELAVNDADAGIVRGTVLTDTLAFDARVPPAMEGDKYWSAAPSLALSQRFDRNLEGLAPGDAFTRSVEIESTSTTSMMLPEPELATPEGLDAYPDIPELIDRSNRGEATAIRRQSITYIVVEPGQYRFPPVSLSWWNTETLERETAELPAVNIDAGAPIMGLPPIMAPGWSWPAMAGTAVLLVLLLLVLRRQHRQPDPLKRARQALRRGNMPATARALYAWLNRNSGKPGWLSLRETAATVDAEAAADALLASSFGKQAQPVPEARGLLRRLARPGRRKPVPPALSLNPSQPRK